MLRGAQPDATDDRIDEQVRARLQRQEVLLKDDPPHLWCVADEGVVHRCIGGRDIMHEQLAHLTRMTKHSRTSVQVIPFGAGAHAGLLAHFAIAEVDGQRDTVHLETATVGR